MPEVCAKEALVMTIANKIATNEINIFMARIVPVTGDRWQVRSDLFGNRFEISRGSQKRGLLPGSKAGGLALETHWRKILK